MQALFSVISVSFALVLVFTKVSAQNHDSLCLNQTQCDHESFLECVPLYNQFSNGVCRCRPGTIWHPVVEECRQEAGHTCAVTDVAPKCVPNSVCNMGVCTCNAPYYTPSIGSFCLAGYGRECDDGTVQFAQCDISLRLLCRDPPLLGNKICLCSGSFIWSETRGKCVGTVETSSSCATNDECVDNTFCSAGPGGIGVRRCRCGPGFSKDAENQCSLVRGANCTQTGNVKCNSLEHLECSSSTNTCVCAGSKLDFNGKCYSVAGGDCNGDVDCGGSSKCHQFARKCFCDQSYNWMELADKTCGKIGRGPNSYCRIGRPDCSSLEYVQCNPIPGTTYGRCECTPEFMFDSETGRCIRQLGDSCAGKNHNCIQNSACILDVCTCLDGSARTEGNKCHKTLGENCSPISNQCNSEYGLICSSATCVCPVGQEWSREKLHCVALISGNCTEVEDYCVANAMCNARGVCECMDGYSQHHETRKCVGSYGQTCNSTSTTNECNDRQFLICAGTSNCTCEYPEQQIWDERNGTCLTLVGGSCGFFQENAGRPRMECVENASCEEDWNQVSKCTCSMGASDDGRCHSTANSLMGSAVFCLVLSLISAWMFV